MEEGPKGILHWYGARSMWRNWSTKSMNLRVNKNLRAFGKKNTRSLGCVWLLAPVCTGWSVQISREKYLFACMTRWIRLSWPSSLIQVHLPTHSQPNILITTTGYCIRWCNQPKHPPFFFISNILLFTITTVCLLSSRIYDAGPTKSYASI